MQTAIRHVVILSLLPRGPKRIDARTLWSRVVERGIEVELRVVQRDLAHLARHFPIVCDEGTRPYGWCWAKSAPPLASAGLDLTTAFALFVVHALSAGALPAALHRGLGPLADAGRRSLDAHTAPGATRLTRRLRVVAPPETGGAPPIRAPVLDAVLRALASGRRLSARYRYVGDRVQPFTLHPLGLVWHRGSLLLVARAVTDEQPRPFVLERFRSAEVLPEPADDRDFDLDAYLAQFGLVDAEPRETIALVARLGPEAARVVDEAPIADDQTLESLPDGEVRLRATVEDTAALRFRLRGLGEDVLVEAPAALADDLAASARAVAARYAAARLATAAPSP